MLNITSSNLHTYIFAIFGTIIISIALQFYLKNSQDSEINHLRKKIKKQQQIINTIISNNQHSEHNKQKQQQNMPDFDGLINDINDNDNDGDSNGNNHENFDNDSYFSPQ